MFLNQYILRNVPRYPGYPGYQLFATLAGAQHSWEEDLARNEEQSAQHPWTPPEINLDVSRTLSRTVEIFGKVTDGQGRSENRVGGQLGGIRDTRSLLLCVQPNLVLMSC